MIKNIKLLGLLIISFLSIPLTVNADSYKSLDFQEILADESIEETFEEYKPQSDAITIYLFRGKGCGYCHRFLEFMNSITDEYGKYFKMTSYEVWDDTNNSKLLNEVSAYLEQEASGVPYIVIGDKVFGGYTEDYNEDIKQTITDLYKTAKKKRYDVFAEMKKHPKKTGTSYEEYSKILIWGLIFTFVSTAIIMSYVNLKFRELKSLVMANNQKIANTKITQDRKKKK